MLCVFPIIAHIAGICKFPNIDILFFLQYNKAIYLPCKYEMRKVLL